jgi:glutamyl-tRNA reductase
MHIVCVGISHQTAPVSLRERLAIDREDARRLLEELHAAYPQSELAILSTCNRTEFYVARPLHGHPRIEQLVEFVVARHGVNRDQLHESLYHFDNEQAIRHLFRVACGLDSMVVGEQQIVGQLKQAYDQAQHAETAGRSIHRMFQLALATSRRVRSQTGIDAGRHSVAGAAVEFAQHLFDSVADKTVLMIGAGEMASLTLDRFAAMKPGRLWIANRSFDRAAQLAEQHSAEAKPFDALDDHLVEADVVISSTGAREPVVTAKRFRKVLKRRRYRPTFIVDIAVPRDFEPAVRDLANVYLFDLDDLQRAVADAATGRADAFSDAENLVEQAVGECYALVQTGDVSDLIRRLRRQLHGIGEAETSRTVNRLLAADPKDFEDLLEEHTQRLINKILHKPLQQLGRSGSKQAALYATAIRRLFNVDEEDLDQPESTAPVDQRRPLPSDRDS